MDLRSARGFLIALMMEAASSSETSAHFYQTRRRNNPEDSHLHTRRRENLKSHLMTVQFAFHAKKELTKRAKIKFVRVLLMKTSNTKFCRNPFVLEM
jgi:hypothetical protein